MPPTKKPTVIKKSKFDIGALVHGLQLAMVTLQLVHDSGLLDKNSKGKKIAGASSVISGAVSSVIDDLRQETETMGIVIDAPRIVEASKTRGLLNAFEASKRP